MNTSNKFKRAAAYFWLIAGAFVSIVSGIRLINGILGGQVVFTSYKYNLQFYDTEALIMLASMFIFGLLAFYIGWLKLEK